MERDTQSLFRRILAAGYETLLAVALVFVLALAFLGILILSFPKGSGLGDFYDELVAARPEKSGRRLVLSGASEQAPFAARLATVQRDVRDRPADAIAWSDAHEGQLLQDHHTIQTLARSSASIEFQGDSRLELGENSLVVIKRPEQRRGRQKNASLVILGGRVRGSVGSGSRAASALEFVTAGAKTEILPTGVEEAAFSLTVNPDNSSTFSIFSGAAEIRTETGSKLVRANQSMTISATEPAGVVTDTPLPPTLESPRDGSVVRHGPVIPRVRFTWSKGSDRELSVSTDSSRSDPNYLLEIARDRGFENLVHAERLSGAVFVHGNLGDGRYYWRVRSIDGNVESLPGPTWRLDIVTDSDPPLLHVDLPEEIDSDRLRILGTAEPGAEVFIGDVRITADASGRFDHTLPLERGLNMVVIEAIDAAGNSAYRSQYVTVR